MAMRVLGAQPEIHMLIYHLGFHPIGSWGYGRFFSEEYRDALINSFLEAREVSNKPVLLALRPGQDVRKMEEFLEGCKEVFEDETNLRPLDWIKHQLHMRGSGDESKLPGLERVDANCAHVGIGSPSRNRNSCA